MERDLWIELRVPSEWPRVDTMRTLTNALVRAVARAGVEDLAERLAIVAGELMENAVKYGKAGEAVAFQLRREGDSVVVVVTNVTDPETSAADRLRARIEWLSTFDTALAAYHATIDLLDAGGGVVDGAGLGLARILFEGECRLICNPTNDGCISIEAWRPWPQGERSAA